MHNAHQALQPIGCSNVYRGTISAVVPTDRHRDTYVVFTAHCLKGISTARQLRLIGLAGFRSTSPSRCICPFAPLPVEGRRAHEQRCGQALCVAKLWSDDTVGGGDVLKLAQALEELACEYRNVDAVASSSLKANPTRGGSHLEPRLSSTWDDSEPRAIGVRWEGKIGRAQGLQRVTWRLLGQVVAH